MDGSAAMESPEVLRIHLGREGSSELMSSATVDACLAFLAGSDLTIVDLHGPPPELHPRFRDLVILVRALRRRLVHRCNLAVDAQPEYAHLPELLAQHRVDVVAALPGRPEPGGFALLQALRRFNAAGYGQPGSGLILDLVVPSSGEGESSIGSSLEAQGVRFSGLHIVAQPPVGSGADLQAELQRLASSVQPARVLAVPCRWALTVEWDGSLSDGTGPLGRNVRDPVAPAPLGGWTPEAAPPAV